MERRQGSKTRYSTIAIISSTPSFLPLSSHIPRHAVCQGVSSSIYPTKHGDLILYIVYYPNLPLFRLFIIYIPQTLIIGLHFSTSKTFHFSSKAILLTALVNSFVTTLLNLGMIIRPRPFRNIKMGNPLLISLLCRCVAGLRKLPLTCSRGQITCPRSTDLTPLDLRHNLRLS